MRLHRAKNGLECINMIKADTYDLIFLDLNMPIKNGLDCLKYIESHSPPLTAPVIIYSTSHYLRDIDASFKMGAHYYIIKPADADHLPDVLSDVFARFRKCMERPKKEEFVVGLESNSQLY
jgi:DNA-binding NarL/FixJ family response regulator